MSCRCAFACWRHAVYRTARNQVLSVRASETELLRDLLSGKRINAFLRGRQPTCEGRVQGDPGRSPDGRHQEEHRPQSGAAWTSGHPHGSDLDREVHPVPREQESPSRNTSVLPWAVVGLGGGVATATRGDRSGGAYLTVVIIAIGVGALGYLWGKKKDKKNVTLVIQQPEASGGPLK